MAVTGTEVLINPVLSTGETTTLLLEESPGESKGVCDKLCLSASPLLAPLSVLLSSTGGSELTPYNIPKLSQDSFILLICLLDTDVGSSPPDDVPLLFPTVPLDGSYFLKSKKKL